MERHRDVAEAKRGFLINHLIDELLPPRAGGYRYANVDPVTGQAAWYDLRVKIAKATGAHDKSEPQFATMKSPPGLAKRPKVLRYGKQFRKAAENAE
jgi:hypothetical protein